MLCFSLPVFPNIYVFQYLGFLVLMFLSTYGYPSLILTCFSAVNLFFYLFLSVLSTHYFRSNTWWCFLYRQLFQYFLFFCPWAQQNSKYFYLFVPRALAVDVFSVNRRSENRFHTDRLGFCPHPSASWSPLSPARLNPQTWAHFPHSRRHIY